MLHTYGTSVVGPWHAEAGVPCQDSNASWVSEDGTLAAAAASDGLGSETHSDVGSAVAARVAVDYCDEHARPGADPQETLEVLRGAYRAAYVAVLDRAAEMGESAGEFDATLSLVLLDGDRLFWGQSGDSGIVAGMSDGTYVLVTKMQRDDEGRVYPLCFENHWEFGVLEGVATALLCTDGVLEGMIAPPLLAANTDCPLDRAKARMFLHPLPDDAEHLDEVQRQAAAYLESYPRELIDDDKTVVVVFDDERLPEDQPDDYYAEPDYAAIRERAYQQLYRRSGETSAAGSGDDDLDGPSDREDSGGRGAPEPSPAPDPCPRAVSPAATPGEPPAKGVICRMGGTVAKSLRDSSPALRRAAEAALEAGTVLGRGCIRAIDEALDAVGGSTPPSPEEKGPSGPDA
ncbi:protein phosphatase 2C domain-containing protein [Thermophilibacter sp.]